MGNLRAGYWAHQSLDARAPQHTMEELNFLVKGSSADPYEVTFIKDGSSLTALCTGPAGTYGNFCKHRISILDGISEMIASDNANQVPTCSTTQTVVHRTSATTSSYCSSATV